MARSSTGCDDVRPHQFSSLWNTGILKTIRDESAQQQKVMTPGHHRVGDAAAQRSVGVLSKKFDKICANFPTASPEALTNDAMQALRLPAVPT